MKSKTTKRITKTILTLATIIILLNILNMPILHQQLTDNTTTHFSIINALQMDIEEQQCNTIYFIAHIF